VTIEESVSTLRAEAERLLSKIKTEKDEGTAGQVEQLAERLKGVANTLLERAHFIVITDAQGHMRYGNGAFLDVLADPLADSEEGLDDEGSQTYSGHRIQRTVQQAWEAELQDQDLGHSVLSGPIEVEGAAFREWDLRRTAVAFGAAGAEQAYLNVLRSKGKPLLPAETLEVIEPLLPKLTLYASFFAYGSDSRQGEYLQRLESLMDGLEMAVSNL